VGVEQWPEKKQNFRRKPSGKFWLLTWPLNQVRKLVMLEDYFEEEEEQQQPASAVVVINTASEINPTAPPSVFFLHTKKGHSV
jgi:hypothetical protein